MEAKDLFMGGMFNNIDPVIGLPLYIWEWIFNLIIIGILWAVLWWAWWKPYTPLHGLYYAWKDGSAAAFICDKNLIAEMVPERLAKCIFDYSKEEYEIEIPEHAWYNIPVLGTKMQNISIWIHQKLFYYPTKYLPLSAFNAFRYKIGHVNKDVEIAIQLQKGEWERYPSVICGGVPVDIIVDTDNWTIPNSKQHNAIVKSAREWNKNNPDDQVHSYAKYQKYLLDGNKNGVKISCPPEIKMQFEVPWTRIETAFPMDLEENDWAGKRRQMALDRARDKEALDRWRFALFIVGGGVGFAALIFFGRLIMAILFHPH
jgi:hypothetical protein